jgi:uncharacterized protein (DUF1499 family)
MPEPEPGRPGGERTDGHTDGHPRWRLVLGGLLVTGVLGLAAVRLVAAVIAPPVIGPVDGAPAPCPPSDNCIDTTSDDSRHAAEPLACPEADLVLLADQLAAELPRTQVVEADDAYARLRTTSQVFGFVDDVELFAGDDVVHVRSASRVGRADLGVNRDRVERVRAISGRVPGCR